MSNINSNNIDDLFKRASDKYPLRTDSSDWGRLASALDKDPSLILPSGNIEGDTRKRRRFLWLLLFIPFGAIGYFAWRPANSTSSGVTINNAKGGGMLNSAKGSVPNGGNSTLKGLATGEHAAISPAATGPAATGPAVFSPAAISPAAAIATKNKKVDDLNSGSRKKEDIKNVVNRKEVNSKADYRRKASQVTAGKNESGEPDGPIGGGAVGAPGAVIPGGVAIENAKVGKRAVPINRISDRMLVNTSAMGLPPLKKEKDKNPASPKAIRNRTSGFYAGILVAPELSTVKGQAIKKPGIAAGVLLGYRLNARLGIETGFYVERKKYYTDGEYFDKKNIPVNYDLLNVNGACTMYEFPIHIRYDLSKGEKMKWFATAGLSTYFMSKESYDYQYMYNGYIHSKAVDYNNLSRYWFSMINLSIGYEQKLGKIGNLRVEPYIRIPTSGVGTGNLPILSAGLNLGITRRIW